MDYSEPLTRLEKLPRLISDCLRVGDKEKAYEYLEAVKYQVFEIQTALRMQDSQNLVRMRKLGGKNGTG